MRHLKIFGLALMTVFLMSAGVSSSASATFKKVWEVSECKKEASKIFLFTDSKCTQDSPTKVGEWEILWKEVGATPVAVDTTATLQLQSNGVEVECTGTDTGTVNQNGLDLTSTVTVSSCTLLNGNGLCTSPVTAAAVDLPWHTQLVEVGTELRDLLSSDGAGNPGWKVKCNNGLTNTCTAADGTTAVKNNVPNDTVETTFDASTEEAKCTLGKGTVRGTVTNLALNSAKEMAWLRAV
jgi:hypothetical protein